VRPRRSLTGQFLARAAAGLDRAVTLAVRAATPISDDEPSLGSGHEARVEALRSVEARLASFDLTTFFPEPRVVEPSARDRGAFNARLSRTDLAWESVRTTFLPELAAPYRATHENHVALARLIARPSPRPIAILVLLGQLAVDERVWPLAALDGLGFDCALYVMPFHGRRADPGRSGRPEFPGRDPALAGEGFRQAVTEIRELMLFLRGRGHPRVGLMGMSLGAYTAALAATVASDVDFLAPIVPLASLADFARDHGDLPDAPEPRALEHALLERAYRHVSPVDRPPLIASERVLVIGAKADRITPFSHARRLASHFRAPLVAFHGGHLLQLGRGEAFERLGELLGSIV
jgi:pimeloyl-ACP methyl ester carboxylesterase